MNTRKISMAAQAVRLPDTALSYLRILTLSISCISQNIKHIRLSEDLAFALGVMRTAAILPIQAEGVLMVAETLPYDDAIPVTLKNYRGDKIITHCGVVDLVTEVFGLDFTTHHRKDFKNITLKMSSKLRPVALINILDEANSGY